MRKILLGCLLGAGAMAWLLPAPSFAGGGANLSWVAEDVLPKLQKMKEKAEGKLSSAEAGIQKAAAAEKHLNALAAKYRGEGDSAKAQEAEEVAGIQEGNKKKAEFLRQEALLDKQRAEKAIASVQVTLAHGLVADPRAVYSGFRGEVEFRRNGRSYPLSGRSDPLLMPGDELKTGKESGIDFILEDGHRVHVGPDTTLVFEAEGVNYLKEGNLAAMLQVKAKIKIRQYAKRFEVRTPEAICGVRGTEYSVQVLPDATVLRVHEGSVEVWDLKKTQSVVVEAGYKVYVPKDGLPGTPEKDESWKDLNWDAPLVGE